MRLKILGTAAAEGWPAIFCNCETCNRARAAGGKNFRTRASVQIDDIFKIDLPPDTHYHQYHYGLKLSELKHLFITHSHSDHFAPEEIMYLGSPFAHNLANPPVKIYANDAALGALKDVGAAKLPVELIPAEPFKPIRADHLTFTPIKAAHKPTEEALNYVIQSDTGTVLYASDTGLYEQPTMDHLAQYKFDLLIVECTQGNLGRPSTLHMSFDGVVELRNRLEAIGTLKPETRTVITHFSHNALTLHDELEAIANPEGIEVAYDGIELEV